MIARLGQGPNPGYVEGRVARSFEQMLFECSRMFPHFYVRVSGSGFSLNYFRVDKLSIEVTLKVK